MNQQLIPQPELIALTGTPDHLAALMLSMIARLQQRSQLALIDSGHIFNTVYINKHIPKEKRAVLNTVLVARPYTHGQFRSIVNDCASMPPAASTLVVSALNPSFEEEPSSTEDVLLLLERVRDIPCRTIILGILTEELSHQGPHQESSPKAPLPPADVLSHAGVLSQKSTLEEALKKKIAHLYPV